MSDTLAGLAAYAMPSLGADMDEGSVIEWLVEEGDRVERGQVVARVETEKSDIDIEIWMDGVVADIVVPPNRTVPVGTTLLHVRTTSDHSAMTSLAEPPSGAAIPLDPHETTPDPALDGERRTATHSHSTKSPASVVWASPLARHLARERGIALTDVVGTGPEGAVRMRDLPVAAPGADDQASTATAPTRGDRMRLAIADRMARSHREIPHYRLERDVDLAALTAFLASINEDRPMTERIVPAACFVRAVAIAAAKHKELNGTWTDGHFNPAQDVNVSVAISLRTGGLVTPIVRRADEQTLDEVMTLIREFTTAARTGKLRSQWTGDDSSITVTNLGERGADLVHGLISPPEVALVGFGRIVDRPWVVDGEVVARPIVAATLGADHRATDGAVGSRFLSTLAHALEDPDQL